jgi:hypothetical protein
MKERKSSMNREVFFQGIGRRAIRTGHRRLWRGANNCSCPSRSRSRIRPTPGLNPEPAREVKAVKAVSFTSSSSAKATSRQEKATAQSLDWRRRAVRLVALEQPARIGRFSPSHSKGSICPDISKFSARAVSSLCLATTTMLCNGKQWVMMTSQCLPALINKLQYVGQYLPRSSRPLNARTLVRLDRARRPAQGGQARGAEVDVPSAGPAYVLSECGEAARERRSARAGAQAVVWGGLRGLLLSAQQERWAEPSRGEEGQGKGESREEGGGDDGQEGGRWDGRQGMGRRLTKGQPGKTSTFGSREFS